MKETRVTKLQGDTLHNRHCDEFQKASLAHRNGNGTLDTQLVQVEVRATMVQNRMWNHQVTRQPNAGCTGKKITIRKRRYFQFP